MTHAEIYISFLVAILGVAYPIIIQVVSRIEDKYNSHSVAVLFNNEWVHVAFLGTLIASVIATILWTLDLTPLSYDVIEFMFDCSSGWLVQTYVMMLITAFFLEVRLLMKYSVTLNLAKRIKKLYKRNNDKSNIYFTAASDLLICALRSGNKDAVTFLYEFVGGEFEEFRKKGY